MFPDFEKLLLLAIYILWTSIIPQYCDGDSKKRAREITLMFLINVPQKAGAVLPKDVVKEFLYIDYFDAGVKGRKVVLTPIKITPAFPQVVF